ncbi:MAG: Uncharacterized protein G01um1014106_449, partial [Parcubacteria group bacterium Gr01-1014_106]
MRTTLPLIAVDRDRFLQRVLEMIPGALAWGTLIGLTILAFLQPLVIAVFLIVYDFYWLVRAVYMGTHLVAGYRTLRWNRGANWRDRLERLRDIPEAVRSVERRIEQLEERMPAVTQHSERRALKRALWQERMFRNDLQRLARISAPSLPSWNDIIHLVVLPTYKEPLSVLTQSLDALVAAEYPKDRLWVVVALEERAGMHTAHTQAALEQRYRGIFGKFVTTVHPDGIAGERQVKSANASYAAREVQKLFDADGIPYENVIVSNFDADTVAANDYFGALTYTYLVTPDRLRCSYQPLPLYHNNIWDAPAFTRIVSTNSSFWMLTQFMRPEKLVTFSSHSMPFRTLVDVGFWDPTVVSEDSRIFWQCYVQYGGHYRTVPLHTHVSMDVTCASTMHRTFFHQYKQIRRWAWGVENFPFIAKAFLTHREIPLRDRARRMFTLLEGGHSWATAPLILAFLGWIPVLFGHAEFQQTVLAFSLPRLTRTLLTV